ncbi:hypothetical protein [Streptomyces sp. NPDC048623]|uniref:hypothetical protein n=1 Tax=Streptomyces sp. NPDC048623 TaxID=3155761 RepID=UPI0034327084
MTTYIVRHGQTNHGKRYLVNGVLAKRIRLNATAVFQISEGSAVATVESVSPSHSLDKKDLPHA